MRDTNYTKVYIAVELAISTEIFKEDAWVENWAIFNPISSVLSFIVDLPTLSSKKFFKLTRSLPSSPENFPATELGLNYIPIIHLPIFLVEIGGFICYVIWLRCNIKFFRSYLSG